MRLKLFVLEDLYQEEKFTHPGLTFGMVEMAENLFMFSSECTALCNDCHKCRKVKKTVKEVEV